MSQYTGWVTVSASVDDGDYSLEKYETSKSMMPAQ